MGILGEMRPLWGKPAGKAKLPKVKYDVEYALNVHLHPHPEMTRHRAANGDLILCVERQLHPVERIFARFLKFRKLRRIVLDRYGEFMLTEALKPENTLGDVAAAMAAEFGIELEHAKRGVIQMVQELMLREFVFLIRD